MKVRYSYLPQQFNNADDLWRDLKEFVRTGDFTLGKPLTEFENTTQTIIILGNTPLPSPEAIRACTSSRSNAPDRLPRRDAALANRGVG